MRNRVLASLSLAAAGLLAGSVSAMDMVTVGNPNNPADTRYNSIAVGSVGYEYQISKYEVTSAQYVEFLNAVAQTDTYGLYAPRMNKADYGGQQGCNIVRTGSSGSYSYSVAADWANRPVNYLSWGDAARFANWMANGKPTGAQGAGTTETGSYNLNGATSAADLIAVTRSSNATWVIPTENEWYKAAYYDPNKPGGAGYWDQATRSNSTPSYVLSATGTNNANYLYYDYGTGMTTYTIGEPYKTTEVGAFAASVSGYGTYDQAGNIVEWNETATTATRRGIRGGCFAFNQTSLPASMRHSPWDPDAEWASTGIRLALVPEPTSLVLLALAGLGLLPRRRR